MANDSRGLGRGLGSLLGAELRVSPSRGGGTLPVALMQTGSFQPRRALEQQSLQELADSIKANGVIQPVVVRPLLGAAAGEARYEIVAGERRWEAAKLAGLTDIPTIVRQLSDRQAVAVALIENIQREELTAAEEARALKRLIGEFSLTHADVADAVGRSRAAVTNIVRLLELPAEIIELIDSKALSMGHARALLGIEDDVERVRLGQRMAERGCSVREAENLVRKAQRATQEPNRPPRRSSVSEVLQTQSIRVHLHQKANGSGKLVVEFHSAEARDAMVEALKKAAT